MNELLPSVGQDAQLPKMFFLKSRGQDTLLRVKYFI